MDYDDLGYIIIYRRNGTYIEISHDETVNLCKRALEVGIPLPELIKKEVMPDLKLIKFRH